jgi:hypothetical protein
MVRLRDEPVFLALAQKVSEYCTRIGNLKDLARVSGCPTVAVLNLMSCRTSIRSAGCLERLNNSLLCFTNESPASADLTQY